MRSRKEIEECNAFTNRTSWSIERVMVEVLLDIRDLMLKSEKKDVKKKSDL